LFFLVLALHGAALAAVFLAPMLPSWLGLGCAVAVALCGGNALQRHALLASANSICELLLAEDGRIECLTVGGERVDARAASGSTVFPWLIVLLLAQAGGRGSWPVLLMSDSLGRRDWRHLCAWLRWHAAATA